MADVFISYSRADKAVAAELAEDLTNSGVEVWWDSDLYAGQHFPRAIQEHLTNCKACVVIWSDTAAVSEWVQDEAAYAKDAGKLVSTRIPEFDLGKLPPFGGFRRLHTVDVTDREAVLRAISQFNVDLAQQATPQRYKNVSPIRTFHELLPDYDRRKVQALVRDLQKPVSTFQIKSISDNISDFINEYQGQWDEYLIIVSAIDSGIPFTEPGVLELVNAVRSLFENSDNPLHRTSFSFFLERLINQVKWRVPF